MAPEAIFATMGTAVGAVILGLGMYVMNMLQKCLHTCQNDGQGHSPLLRFICGEITLTEGMWPDLFWCCPTWAGSGVKSCSLRQSGSFFE
jgi:hypothetical protein